MMPKTLKSLLHEAKAKMELWELKTEDDDYLNVRSMSRNEAVHLANYSKGRYDALCDAIELKGVSTAFNDDVKALTDLSNWCDSEYGQDENVTWLDSAISEYLQHITTEADNE